MGYLILLIAVCWAIGQIQLFKVAFRALFKVKGTSMSKVLEDSLLMKMGLLNNPKCPPDDDDTWTAYEVEYSEILKGITEAGDHIVTEIPRQNPKLVLASYVVRRKTFEVTNMAFQLDLIKYQTSGYYIPAIRISRNGEFLCAHLGDSVSRRKLSARLARYL